jgi:hypothetical protein
MRRSQIAATVCPSSSVKNRHGLFLLAQQTIDPAAAAVVTWMNLRRVIRLKLRMVFSRIT